MKAQIRRWSNEENKNYFVDVDVFEQGGTVGVSLDGITLVDGYSTVNDALNAAQTIIRDRKLSNSVTEEDEDVNPYLLSRKECEDGLAKLRRNS